MSNDHPTWLTVVTLHKADPTGLAATVDSIARQDLDGVHHLVVESGEQRSPVQGPTWTQMNVQVHGIYESMNAALQHVHGDYVLFLNSGDTLHDTEVLHDVRNPLKSMEPSWAYGSVVLFPRVGVPRPQPRFTYSLERKARFSRGRFPMQPATIIRTSVLKSLGGFDETYRIAADYKLMLQLARQAEPLVLDREITDFRLGGVSSVRWSDSLAEARRARTEVFPPSRVEWIQDMGHAAISHAKAVASRALGRV